MHETSMLYTLKICNFYLPIIPKKKYCEKINIGKGETGVCRYVNKVQKSLRWRPVEGLLGEDSYQPEEASRMLGCTCTDYS